MRIGELARRTGVSRRSLRYYEQHGLLHARRGGNDWRDYDEPAVERVRAIAELLATGLTLDGVKDLVPCLEEHDLERCADTELPARTYRARLAEVESRLSVLQDTRDRLTRRITSL